MDLTFRPEDWTLCWLKADAGISEAFFPSSKGLVFDDFISFEDACAFRVELRETWFYAITDA